MDNGRLSRQALARMPNPPRFPPNAVRVVEVLAFPSVQVLDVTGPLQVFASTNDIVAATGAAPPYAMRVMARGGQGVTASSGLGLLASPLASWDAPVDTLIVAGGPGVEAAAADPFLVDWLRRRAGRARRVASVCTGAFLLATSGVLDGRRAAPHWWTARSGPRPGSLPAST